MARCNVFTHAVDKARKAAGRIDWGGMSDKARKGALLVTPTDHMYNWHKDLFEPRTLTDPNTKIKVASHEGNPLLKWRQAIEARTRAFHEFAGHKDAKGVSREERGDQIQDDFRKLTIQQRDTLADLQNRATIAKADLLGGSNAHLATKAQTDQLAKLQQEFNRLPSAMKKNYKDRVEFFNEIESARKEAELEHAIKIGFPDATRVQAEALATQVKTKRGIKQLLDDPDATPLAKAFGAAWVDKAPMAREIAKVQDRGFQQGNWVPLRRFGEYVVHAGEKDTPNYSVEFFERKSEAEAYRAELLEKYNQDKKKNPEPSLVLAKNDVKLHNVVSDAVARDLDNAITRAKGFTPEQAGQVRDMFAAIRMHQAGRAEAAASRLRRKGVAGASKDAARVFANEVLSVASATAHLKTQPDINKAISEMRQVERWLGEHGEPNEQINAHAVRGEVELKSAPTDNFTSRKTQEGIKQAITTFGFTQSLLSLARLSHETITTHAVGGSLLSSRHGPMRSGLAVMRAMKDLTPELVGKGLAGSYKALGGKLKTSDWNLSTVARDQLITAGNKAEHMMPLFRKANNAGLGDYSINREMLRIAKGDTKIGQAVEYFLSLTTFLQHSVDTLNKSAYLKAAFDLEYGRVSRDPKLSEKQRVEQASDYAVDEIMRMVQPNFNLHAKNRFSTGQKLIAGKDVPLMQAVTQFKTYGFHLYGMLANLTRDAIKGKTAEEKTQARKALAYLGGVHLMVAGVEGSILADLVRYIGGAYDLLFDDKEKPHDHMADIRAAVAEMTGSPTAGEIFGKGVFTQIGIDPHRSIGMADALGIPPWEEFNSKAAGKMLLGAMTGAAGSDALDLVDGFNALRKGNITDALTKLSPRMVADVAKSYKLATRGVTDSQGDTLLSPEQIGVGPVVARALGYNPEVVSEFQAERRGVFQLKDELRNSKSKLIHGWVNNPDSRDSARDRIDAFNDEHPEARIRYQDLRRAAKRQREDERSPGGAQVPKKLRQSARDIAETYNVPR